MKPVYSMCKLLNILAHLEPLLHREPIQLRVV